MIRKRIAALAVASTVAFGTATINTPTAAAEPVPAVLGSAESVYRDVVTAALKMILIPAGLSSLVLAQFAPREYVCDGLVPRFCTEEELEHRRTGFRI